MVAQLVQAMDQLIHTLMQLVLGDLQMIKNLEQKKTLPLIAITQQYHSGSSPAKSLDLAGRNISWRYNSDNSWDLFDEDTDEVILTGDTNLDGGDMYPYLFGASTINTYATEIPQWTWEWNAASGLLNIVIGKVVSLQSHFLVKFQVQNH